MPTFSITIQPQTQHPSRSPDWPQFKTESNIYYLPIVHFRTADHQHSSTQFASHSSPHPDAVLHYLLPPTCPIYRGIENVDLKSVRPRNGNDETITTQEPHGWLATLYYFTRMEDCEGEVNKFQIQDRWFEWQIFVPVLEYLGKHELLLNYQVIEFFFSKQWLHYWWNQS